MSNTLHVAAIQSELVWESPAENLSHFQGQIETLSEEVDLVVLPEMFSTGFTMHPAGIAETMQGSAVTWMQSMAAEKNAAIMGSLVIKEAGNYVNRCVFVHPSGRTETYDKRHAFTLAGEHESYATGKKKLIVDYKGWKICPLICYDLRFPVWSRNVEHYDLLVYMANWPKPRIQAWDVLLKARAIENMSYVVGVNRIGTDENNYEFSGHSAIIDCLGNEVQALKDHQAGVLEARLLKSAQDKIRGKLNFLNDKDSFTIHDS